MVRRLVPYLLTFPAVVFVGGLFLAPIVTFLATSVIVSGADGTWRFSLALYRAFFSDPYSWHLMARTLRIGLITVVCSLVLAFPVALFLRQTSPRWRAIVSILLLSPLLTSVVVRTLAWVMLLGPKGLLNSSLAAMGLGSVSLIYNETGVVIGLTHVYFGYMLLSLMTSILKIDQNLMMAASNLGADRWQALLKVVIPLSLPGALAGSILVFTVSVSAYVTPVLLGGTNTKVMATDIFDLAIQYLEWREAATLAAILFVMSWGIVTLVSAIVDRTARRRVRA